jgi:hypothetical protein
MIARDYVNQWCRVHGATYYEFPEGVTVYLAHGYIAVIDDTPSPRFTGSSMEAVECVLRRNVYRRV